MPGVGSHWLSRKKHLDLGVVSLSGIVCHPAARLEVEILEVVARSFSARLLVQHFVIRAAFAASMDLGEILEEQPGAINECEQRSIVIRRKRINARLDISEVLQE